jgi:hypothetical protein
MPKPLATLETPGEGRAPWCVLDCDNGRWWWTADLRRAEDIADWLENHGFRSLVYCFMW